MSMSVFILFLFFAGWNVDVMAGALAANFDHETRKGGSRHLCVHGVATSALNTYLDFI